MYENDRSRQCASVSISVFLQPPSLGGENNCFLYTFYSFVKLFMDVMRVYLSGKLCIE